MIYWPSNQNNFLQTFNEDFAKLDTLKKKWYILDDFNINFYQNQNHTEYKNNTLVSTAVFNNVKNYIQLCTMSRLSQIIKSPFRITCCSISLIYSILLNLPDRIFQKGTTNLDLSDHQIIYCTCKISGIKTGGVQKKSNSIYLGIMRLMLIKILWWK